MRIKRLTIFALASIVLGIVVVVGSGGGMWWSWTQFMSAGYGITVPTTISLDVAPGDEMVVWRELAGTHITQNRPLLPPPDDLDITITDRQSGETIETMLHDWRVGQRIMPGFERNRRAIVAFVAPPHGEITVSVQGSFDHEQVYRVSPSVRKWAGSVFPMIQVGAGFGVVLILAGVAILITKAIKQEKRTLAQTDY